MERQYTNLPSDSDFPMWWAPTNPNFSSKQRFPAWAYGLPLSTTVFKANGDPVKATLYSYDTTYIRRKIKVYDLESGPNNASGLWTNLVSCKCQVLKTSSQRSTDYNDAAQYNSNYVPANGNSDMAVEMNAYYTGHVNLSQVREQVYNESSPSAYTETTTSYAYNDVYNGNVDYNSPGNYEVNTITVKKSNGDQLIKTIGYAIQGPQTDPAIAALTANNVVTLPFRTTMYLKRFGSSTQEYLSDSRTDFVQLSNKNVKPSRQVEVRYSQPNTPANNGQEIEVKKFVYDNTGNLIKVADEGGRTVSSLYDYDDKYATATIINSDAAADKVAYTSFETSNTGRWTIGGTAVYSTTQKVTGDRSFQISGSNSLSATSLSTSVAYRLSFWSTAALSVSGGGTQITAAPTINGFTYYEYEFPTGTTSISLTGSGAVDELRLYPKTARMSTVTYDPLIGKTSECDANNRITYYEYDNLGRMRFIRDEKRNIVKMYEYNNVSKQTGCPATFANHYVDEVFIKGNCGANSIGNEYHYTIAAGKYTSTISQEDADAKAQKELLEQGQNTANTSGTCRPNFCNDALSVTVYSEGCGVGFKGGAVTYTVPSGRYCTISKDSANALAGEEIDANAQAYANDPAHRVCVVDYDPDWQAEDNAPKECRLDNGQNYVFILATDVNPNSSTYGTTSWKNTGEQGSCAVIYCNIYYTNSTYDPQLITLTNINTGVQTTTRLYPMSTNALLANLPVGYYEVTIVNETTSNSHQYSICSSYFVSGNGATFGGVYLSTGCSTININ